MNINWDMLPRIYPILAKHYNDVIMSAMASEFISLMIVYSTVYSGADQRKNQISASLAFVRGIHRSTVNSPHKGSVTRKMFPFDDVIVSCHYLTRCRIQSMMLFAVTRAQWVKCEAMNIIEVTDAKFGWRKCQIATPRKIRNARHILIMEQAVLITIKRAVMQSHLVPFT